VIAAHARRADGGRGDRARAGRVAVVVAGAAAVGAATLGGCSSPGPGVPRAAATGPGSTTTAATGPTSTGASSPAPSTTIAGVRNLPVTSGLRTLLVGAGAALNHLPASAYTGLVPGTTYYACDQASATCWAAAGLVPSASSVQAQVSTQDDGSYLFFTSTGSGAWIAVADGLGGIGGTACPAIPPAVVAAWGWAPGTCRPPS